MSPRAVVTILLAAWLGAAGCEGEGDDGGDVVGDVGGTPVDLPPMLPGAVVLHARHQAWGDAHPTGIPWDAHVDQARVVVLLDRAGGSVLLVSDDSGASFRVVSIADDSMGSEPHAVYAAHGKVFVVQAGFSATPTLVVKPGSLQEIDLATGARGTAIAMPIEHPPRFHRDAEAIAGFSADTGGLIEWVRFEVATGAVQQVTRPHTADDACLADRGDGRVPVTRDGIRWTTLCHERSARCLVTFDGAADGTTTSACVPLGEWPIGAHVAHTIIARDDGVHLLHSEGGRLVARRFALDPPSLEPPVDLGPGVLGPFAMFGTDVGGGLLRALDLTGAVRLVEWPAVGGARTVPLPPSVCLDPTACSSRGVNVIVPLDAARERWLGIYAFTWNEALSSFYVVARELAPGDDGPPFLAPPADAHDGGPPPPEAPAESALERVCLRALGCFPTFGMEDCVARWLSVRGATTEDDVSYQAFLATGPACDDFVATFPEVALRGDCTPACNGDAAFFTCVPEPLGAAALCEAGACVLDAGVTTCAGAAAYDPTTCGTCVGETAVRCRQGRVEQVIDCAARGLACLPGGANFEVAWCGPGGPCRSNQFPMQCRAASDDTVARGAPLQLLDVCHWPRVVDTLDCERAGLLCDTGFELGASGQCGTMVRPYATCVTGPGSRCDGDALLYCVGGQQRFVDCAAQGQVCAPHTSATQAEAHCRER